MMPSLQACDANLEVRCGCFGFATDWGSSATDITMATGKMFRDFATRYLGAPVRRGTEDPIATKRSIGTEQHLKDITLFQEMQTA